jgi:hypothetical protein
MTYDLNNWTMPLQRGGSAEIWDPLNAWPSAPSRIYVDVNRMPYGSYQTGYDPVTGRNWMRYKAFDDASWSTWKSFDGSTTPDAPVPISAYAIDTRASVVVNFSILLDPSSIPLTTAFAVTGRTVSTVYIGAATAGGPNTCKLVLNTPLPATGSPTVSYTQPAPPRLKSIDGVDVASFSNFAITLTL